MVNVPQGAPEILLPECSHLLHEGGNLVAMTEDIKNDALQVIQDMSNMGFRTLLLAHKDVPAGA